MKKIGEKKILSAKKLLIQTAMVFLIPFFVFLLLLFLYSGRTYKEKQIQNSRDRITMYLSELEMICRMQRNIC